MLILDAGIIGVTLEMARLADSMPAGGFNWRIFEYEELDVFRVELLSHCVLAAFCTLGEQVFWLTTDLVANNLGSVEEKGETFGALSRGLLVAEPLSIVEELEDGVLDRGAVVV